MAATLATQAGGAASTASCHADLLVQGINFGALTEQEKTAVGTAVRQKIALETGMAESDVMSKIFAGNYNAPWSPSANRPQAAAFMASLVNKCQSAEMVLGVFRGPQLQEAVESALVSSVPQRAVEGGIKIIGASVVPEKLTTTTPGASGGSPQLP